MFDKKPVYDLEIDGHHIQLPIEISTDRTKLDTVVSTLREALTAYRSHHV